MASKIQMGGGLVLSIVFFTLLAAFFKGVGASDFILAMLSASSFLFSILMAFFISDRHSRLKETRESLRVGDAAVVDIHKQISVFGEKTKAGFKQLLDEWIIATVDYDPIDFYKTVPCFFKAYDFIVRLKPSTETQKTAHANLMQLMQEENRYNKKIQYLVTDRLSRFEWVSIFSLSAIIIFCLFYINTNSLVSITLTILLSVVLVMLLMVLREMDTLCWKEQKWQWEPLMELYNELELTPYVPKSFFDRNKKDLPKGSYRVVHYTHPYPDFSDKKIEIVNQ
jgi:Na+/melibiose symporter-like transporter